MSLYDDIEPSVKRVSPDRSRISESSFQNEPRKKNSSISKDNAYGANMFAPRTLMSKTATPQSRTNAPLIHRAPAYNIPPPQMPYSSAASSFLSTATPNYSINAVLEAAKNQVVQKKLEIEKIAKGPQHLLPTLKAHKVDVSQIKGVPIIPLDVREDTEFLFDEVHILDEYNPQNPNAYVKFMQSIGCNPKFGEEVDDSKLERLILDEIINGQSERDRTPSPDLEEEAMPKQAVVANMMAKMGYTHGSGLGKHGQGMSSALKVEKTAGQGGIILSEVDEILRGNGLTREDIRGPLTNVLLIRNIYLIDDIPDDYDAELRTELEKNGHIKKLILHKDSEAEDAYDQVRIFVEYSNRSSAIQAYANLNHRIFDGRQIRANFYPLDRFALGHYYDPIY